MVFGPAHKWCKMVRMHPLVQLLLSPRDGHQRRVVWHVVSAPVARHNDAESKRGDNTSAISSEDLLEEVNHVTFFLGLTIDRGVSLSRETTFVFLVTFIWSFPFIWCFSDSLYLGRAPLQKKTETDSPPAATGCLAVAAPDDEAPVSTGCCVRVALVELKRDVGFPLGRNKRLCT